MILRRALSSFFFTFISHEFSPRCLGRIVCYVGFPKMLVSGINHFAPSGGSQLLLNSFIMTASNGRTTMNTSWHVSKSESVACAMPISGKMVQLYMRGRGGQFGERKRQDWQTISICSKMSEFHWKKLLAKYMIPSSNITATETG